MGRVVGSTLGVIVERWPEFFSLFWGMTSLASVKTDPQIVRQALMHTCTCGGLERSLLKCIIYLGRREILSSLVLERPFQMDDLVFESLYVIGEAIPLSRRRNLVTEEQVNIVKTLIAANPGVLDFNDTQSVANMSFRKPGRPPKSTVTPFEYLWSLNHESMRNALAEQARPLMEALIAIRNNVETHGGILPRGSAPDEFYSNSNMAIPGVRTFALQSEVVSHLLQMALESAVKEGDAARVAALVVAGANHRDGRYLASAIGRGHADVVGFLLRSLDPTCFYSASSNKKIAMTPLQLATHQRDTVPGGDRDRIVTTVANAVECWTRRRMR
jgi:hypothetical protein